MESSSDNIAVEVRDLWKAYNIWKDPKARLKFPLLQLTGKILTNSKIPLLGSAAGILTNKAGKYCSQFNALRGVSFAVQKGEALGIVGLNGSGKSTLLQILAGVLKPSRGEYRTHGRVAALLELGAGFNGEFTGRENVFLNGAIMGVPREVMEERFQQITDFAEIGEFIDQPVKTYSSGMVVRLAFSVLTQIDPDILIIDEALSVGDAYFQHKSGQVIKKFREQGKTLLFVAHDPGAVKSLCDHAILLDKGIVVKTGDSESVLDYYNAIIAKKEKDQEIRQIESDTGRTITRSGNKKAEIHSIEFLNEKGSPTRSFVSGEDAKLKATVSFSDLVEDPTFGILIRDRLGNDVFGTNTFFSDTRCADKNNGETVEVEVKLSLKLGPGSYSITLAVHSGAEHTDENYDWIDHAIVIEIVPPAGKHFIGTAALPCQMEWITPNSEI